MHAVNAWMYVPCSMQQWLFSFPLIQGILLGAVSSIERNHEQVDLAKAGEEVRYTFELARWNLRIPALA